MGSFGYISTVEHSIRRAGTSTPAATCLARSTDASYVGTYAANATSITAGSATDVFFSADSSKRASCRAGSDPEYAYGHASYVAGRVHERLCLWTRPQKVSRGEFGSHAFRSVLEAERMRFELLYQTFNGSHNHVDCLLDHPSRLRMNNLLLCQTRPDRIHPMAGWQLENIKYLHERHRRHSTTTFFAPGSGCHPQIGTIFRCRKSANTQSIPSQPGRRGRLSEFAWRGSGFEMRNVTDSKLCGCRMLLGGYRAPIGVIASPHLHRCSRDNTVPLMTEEIIFYAWQCTLDRVSI